MAHRGLHTQLPVVLVPDSNNFVRLPRTFAQSIRGAFPAKTHGVVAFRVGWLAPPTPESGGLARPTQAFVGWRDGLADGHFIQVPVGLAESLGLKEAVECAQAVAPDAPLIASVAVVPYAPVASRVDVDPVTPEDWEILQLHANFVEEELLGQICVLGPGQRFPMWVYGRTRINLQVTSIGLVEQKQALCVRLARDTQVVVAPKLRAKQEQFDTQAQRQRELEGSSAVLAYELRVQDPLLEEVAEGSAGQVGGLKHNEWNCTGVVHPTTLRRMSSAAKWPSLTVGSDGSVRYTSDPSRPVVAVMSNRNRARMLEKVRKASAASAGPSRGPVSSGSPNTSREEGGVRGSGGALQTNKSGLGTNLGPLASTCNQVFVRLHASSDCALGHIMLPRSVQVGCRVAALDRVVVTLPRFEPISLPKAFPPSLVQLYLVLGQDQASVTDSRFTQQQFEHAVAQAARAWQNGLGEDRSGGAPVTNGSLVSLSVDCNRVSRQLVFAVRVEEGHSEAGAKSEGGEEKGSSTDVEGSNRGKTLEPVHWWLFGDAKVEWKLVSFPVDLAGQRMTPRGAIGGEQDAADFDGTGGAGSQVAIGSSTSIGSGAGDWKGFKALIAGGMGAWNKQQLAGKAPRSLGASAGLIGQMRERLGPVLDSRMAVKRLGLGTPHPGGVYLVGGRGAGKSTLAGAVARELRCSQASLAKTIWISCADLRGGKRSEVETIISQAFREAISQAPALLVFDDLDLLLPAPAGGGGDGGGGGGGGGEDGQLVWLAEWLEDLLNEYKVKLEGFEQHEKRLGVGLADRNVTQRAVSWVATGREKGSLRGSLLRTGLFDRVIEIPPLTAHDRTAVLEALVAERGDACEAKGLDLDEIAARAEGYAAADLDTLVERAVHCALVRSYALDTTSEMGTELGLAAKLAIEQADFEAALEGFTPAALRGVALAKSDVKWSDVGGLHTVRRVLKETLELPIQFAPLFERSPQRLASGVLLYGPPGCGKTLLAGAVAKECGLNFISVKGPEVLNKYIGASEQAVRDLFARGAAAAPCIVFFDEFDAVAPRRGNDSSGVTDRVVNQLLTFLDGVESRSGVYVMAATSRPDLVDPALLRPGRLDKQLLCGFPDAAERLDILRTIAGKMDLHPTAESELERISTLPEAELFTGADLQALLYSAQLATIHAGLELSAAAPAAAAEAEAQAEGSTTSRGAGPPSSPRILPGHLQDALREARPSVSAEERERYNRIYDAFKGDRGADFNAVSGYPDGKQRTALR